VGEDQGSDEICRSPHALSASYLVRCVLPGREIIYARPSKITKQVWRPPISKECDFIIKRGTKPVSAIQVCWELNQQNQEREFRRLVEGMETLDIEEGVVLTYNDERKTEFKGRTISILPVWKWLLI